MVEQMKMKRSREPYLSDVDMSLLIYSKETGASIVTNDNDFYLLYG